MVDTHKNMNGPNSMISNSFLEILKIIVFRYLGYLTLQLNHINSSAGQRTNPILRRNEFNTHLFETRSRSDAEGKNIIYILFALRFSILKS